VKQPLSITFRVECSANEISDSGERQGQEDDVEKWLAPIGGFPAPAVCDMNKAVNQFRAEEKEWGADADNGARQSPAVRDSWRCWAFFHDRTGLTFPLAGRLTAGPAIE